MVWAEYLTRLGERKHAYRDLLARSEVKRPLRRPKHMLEDNIKIDLQEVGRGFGLDCFVSR